MTYLGYTVDPNTNCHVYNGKPHRNGYSQFKVGGKHYYGHRWYYEQKHGPIPANLQVLHRCDNPMCVNVDHLWVGTPQDNMEDMRIKGRENNLLSCKLTAEQVLTIREEKRKYLAGEPFITVAQLSQRFGVSHETITNVRSGATYKHVK